MSLSQSALVAKSRQHTVFIQSQGAARMLHKQVQQPDFVTANLGECADNLVSDEIRTPRLGGQCKLFLEPSHFTGTRVYVSSRAEVRDQS